VQEKETSRREVLVRIVGVQEPESGVGDGFAKTRGSDGWPGPQPYAS